MAQNSETITSSASFMPLDYDFKVLQRLRNSCRITLERYIDVASHCSGQLFRLTPGSIHDLTRANVALLQKKEEDARQAYVKAKSALLEYLSREHAAGAAK